MDQPLSIHDRLKSLLEGTYEAFEICGAVNTDYAEFASLSLLDFKAAMENPALTGNQLRRAIRSGYSQHHNGSMEEGWASFMARYMSLSANSNANEGLC
ncbi:MAG: hypothetical protein IT559_01880 [Alphaproteobacteria bacterium]|nr:hypothetical protein [Alphaproteobacteria bacterium]